ncbi:MAG TPA: methionyl-tRNA formyltransferase [Candidatus Paceibacterota bacterium]|nr:methionyl-tRNA formyltransferase [Candidatus Paceibacterota bacterium]
MHKPFVYFGTPYVARDTLAILVERGYTPALVVSTPDARRGRGMELQPSETKAWATEKNIPVITPEKLTPVVIEEIRATKAEFAIVVAYGKILPLPIFDIFPNGILNIHYSLLPKYRGASPVESALLAGETVTGVSIQKMVHELDAGDIVAAREVAITPTETTRELRPRLIQEGAELLIDILPSFEAGTLSSIAQDPAAVTYAKKIAKEEGQLDLSGDARTNWNKYRAYAESPGTFFYADKNGTPVRVKIKSATFVDGVFMPDRVVPEGKKEMAYADFVR